MSFDGISIIATSYNSGKYLMELVNSIYSLNIKSEFELIIVDDCSTELRTQQVLEYLTNNDKAKVIINKKNCGVQYARNLGFSAAKGKFIMLIDGDDFLNSDYHIGNKNYIDHALDVLTNDDIAFVHSYSYMVGDYTGHTITSYPLTEELIVKKHHVPTSIIYRKGDILCNNPYDTNIFKWQDWSFGIHLLNCRIKKNKKNIIYCVEGICHFYRIHNTTNRISEREISELNMTLLTIKKNKEIFYKYFSNYLKDEELATKLLENKPSRLEELLYISKNNFELAKKIISERSAYLGPVFVGVP